MTINGIDALPMSSVKTAVTIPGLVQNWDFHCDPVPRWRRRQTVEMAFARACKSPAWSVIKPVVAKAAWTVYFLYSPDGVLSAAHRFTLARMRDSGVNLLVVCTTREPALVPAELHAYANALLWKGLEGYDFSAYTLALRQISKKSSGADVLLFNDSVFGPFSDITKCVTQSRWDFTGFTASSTIAHHIQSYAFGLKAVNAARMLHLAPVFFPFFAVNDREAAILLQEVRLARVASRSMKVGAFWYGDANDLFDPTMVRPFELIDAGFPFLKRSLLGRGAEYQDSERVRAVLQGLGHPL